MLKTNKSLSDLTITLICNNNCVMCPRKLLSMIACSDNIGSIFQALKKTRKTSENITLTGGEVTILPAFFKILKECQRLNFRKVSLISNGRMFSNKEFIHKFKKSIVTSVGVSVYSTNKIIHDCIARSNGACQQTIEGLKKLLKIENLHLWVNITVSSYNVKDLSKTMKDLYRLGVREFLLISVISDDEKINYNFKDFNNQINSLNKALPDSVVIFRGFPNEIIKFVNMKKFRCRNMKIENHNFDTFVSINNLGDKYLQKTKKYKKK